MILFTLEVRYMFMRILLTILIRFVIFLVFGYMIQYRADNLHKLELEAAIEKTTQEGIENCEIEQEEVRADFENQIKELERQIKALKAKGK